LYFSSHIICSEDWFLRVSYNGVQDECLLKDPRAIDEYNAVKNYLETKFSDYGYYQQGFDDEDITIDNISPILPMQLIKHENEGKK